jgi:hypothetical protein
LHRSVETLLRYLSDRRPKVAGALSAVQITPAQSHKIVTLSETSVEDLFSQPNAALISLTPEQLVRCAQIVDTALFKSYLLIRPGLLGPLCRVANWCEVSEVEEELRAREVRSIVLRTSSYRSLIQDSEIRRTHRSLSREENACQGVRPPSPVRYSLLSTYYLLLLN